MPKRARPSYIQVSEPVEECITKFGGQPNWYSDPEWPTDSMTGKKMSFICQIALHAELFGKVQGKMAYVFMSDDEESGVDDTWDPDAGRNAVVVQPGNNAMQTVNDAKGPEQRMSRDYFDVFDENGLCEFTVQYEIENEPSYADEKQIQKLIDTNEYDGYGSKMEVDKIGGSPIFIQSEELPIKGNWKLLFQLEDSSIPFYVNFGCGVGYAFIDEDGTFGKLLWQC